MTKAKDNLKSLGTLLIGRSDASLREYEGKNYVLAVLLSSGVDLTDPKNIDALFSPTIPASQRPGPEAYADVTLESLKTKSYAHLTSYEVLAKPAQRVDGSGSPLLVDRTRPDAVLVFFTNGSVSELTPEEFARY